MLRRLYKCGVTKEGMQGKERKTKMKKKLVVLLLATTMSLSVVACGGEKKSDTNAENISKNESISNASKKEVAEKKEPIPIVLTESGYTVRDDGFGNVYVNYAATINNPNKDLAGTFPKIIATAKGADGTIVGTQEQTLFNIAPEDTLSFGNLIDCNGVKPESVEISVECHDFIPGDSDGVVNSSAFSVSNTSELPGQYGDVSYTGEVENTGQEDATSVALTLILKNNGNIVYGATTFTDNVPAGSKKAFEFSEYNIPEHTEFIISAQAW